MKAILAIAMLAAAACFVIVGTGCEVKSAESASQSEIQISPSSVHLSTGESAEFTATGWHEYIWSLSAPEYGTLSHTTGDKTVYTAVVGSNLTQVLTCSASIAGTNGSTTVSATALIIQN